MMIRKRSSSDERDASNNGIKFLCSYGGLILPRLTDGKLRYVGGHTRVLSVDRQISYTELMVKLGEFCGSSVKMRCQLPDGNLETLISITCDEDLRHVIAEYDKASNSSQRFKIRAILSPLKSLKSISPPVSPSPSTPHQFNSPTSICPPVAMKEARCVFGRPVLACAGNNHHQMYYYYLVRQPRSYSCIN